MRHWTLEEATAALPEVRGLVARLRELAASAGQQAHAASGNGVSTNGNGQHAPKRASDELREVLAKLEDLGIIVRDPERGLIDFPALAGDGRTYLLCWLDGEDAIDWWHWPEDGFPGRTPLTSPPT
jgi:hypothetical protein